jgi:putative endonuclease
VVRANTRALGNYAEQCALRFLKKKGLRPVTRNYRCRHGEIDLIMLDGNCLVFVEVRFRAGTSFTRAALTVDARKQRKLAKTAEMFLATRRGHTRNPARFDVVGFDRDADGATTVEWLQDAFSL